VIDPIVKRDDYKTLAIVMGQRQPKLAALWLGAIISGVDRRTKEQVSDFQARTVTAMPLLFVLIFTFHPAITQQLALTTTRVTCSSQVVQVPPSATGSSSCIVRAVWKPEVEQPVY
jgi:hypothetical protein